MDRLDPDEKSKALKTIFYYLTWKGDRIRKSTGKKCKQSDWIEEDKKKAKVQRVDAKVEYSSKINPYLSDLEYKVEKFFENRKQVPSKKEVLDLISGESIAETKDEFIPLFKKFILESETGIRLTKKGKRIKPLTIKSYNQTLSILEAFEEKKGLKLIWENINDKFYNRFTGFMWNDLEYYDNAVGSRIRVLKTFLNWCVDEKYIPHKIYNSTWITWEEEIDIVVLYPDELQLLFNLSPPTDRLDRVKDTFLSGCMTCLRVSNLLGLKKHDRNGEQLKLISVKSDKLITLDINPLLSKIFDKYDQETLLPEISEQKFNDGLKDLAKWFKKYLGDNKDKLKAGFVGNDWNRQFLRTRYKMGEPKRLKVDLDQMITSHTMRRTGITNLLMMGLSETEVKTISGHSLNSKDFTKYVKIAEQFISKKSTDAWNKIASQN